MTVGQNYDIDAVRSDGGLVHIRLLRPDDRDALLALDRSVGDETIRMRFFGVSRSAADRYAVELAERSAEHHDALGAWSDATLVGVASFVPLGDGTAELAVLVDDRSQHEGVGTLLIEHLASLARHQGVTRFVAEVLTENTEMTTVLRRLGLDVRSTLERGSTRIEIDLTPSPRLTEALDSREASADVRSIRRLLEPRSLVVVGAGTRPGAVGHEVLRALLAGGYTGSLRVVNPHHTRVLGVPCAASVAELDTVPELAVVAVPAADVPGVIEQCGRRGIPGAVVISAGFGEAGVDGQRLQRELDEAARRHGVRVIGPNCLGVLTTDPAVRLNATFADPAMRPGPLALASQSGALGIALLDAAARRGLYAAQFVSLGNKLDVSGNDLLMAWEDDDRVGIVALYLESFGNPRKFARIARRVAARKPVVAIKSGRSAAGVRAGQSHTAAAATDDVVVDALMQRAGVIRVRTMAELLDTALLLTEQPVPKGPRIAVVGNSGGPEILAADAASAAGLVVGELSGATQALLRAIVPTAASVANPVDLGAGCLPVQAAQAARILLDADEVDAVVGVVTGTRAASGTRTLAAMVTASAGADTPLVLADVGTHDRSLLVPGSTRHVPVFAFPEPAVAAVGLAWAYGRLRALPGSDPVRPAGVNRDAAAGLARNILHAGAGWVGPADTARLLGHYGIPMIAHEVASTAEQAVAAADTLGYPVAMKLTGQVVHKSDIGGVVLGIEDADRARSAYARLAGLGDGRVLVQPMAPAGVELLLGGMQEAQCGALAMVGAGGVLADVSADRVVRLAPLTEAEAEDMIASLRSVRLLDGYRGRPVVSRAAVRDVLLRVAALVDDVPEIAELDLNPLVCSGGDRVTVLDAKIRLAEPPARPDPWVRDLRG